MKASDQFYINTGWGKHLLLTWWRHQMETFSSLLAICAGNSPVPGEFPTQRPVTRSFDVFFDLHLNEWLSKQLWGWWFETLLRSLWRHRNEVIIVLLKSGVMDEGDGLVCIICCQNICSHYVCSVKMKKIYHARDLKNWLGLVNKCIYYAQWRLPGHCGDLILDMMASQITSLTIVYLTVCSGAHQRKHQSSAFPFDDVIMYCLTQWVSVGETQPNFDSCVLLVNVNTNTHPSHLRERKDPTTPMSKGLDVRRRRPICRTHGQPLCKLSLSSFGLQQENHSLN